MDDTGLILLVVVDPVPLWPAAGHRLHDRAHLSGSNPGLATGSEKHDRNPAKVEGVASGRTTEKCRAFENVAATSKPARRSSPQRARRTSGRRRTWLTASLSATRSSPGTPNTDIPKNPYRSQQSPLARSKLASLRLLRPPRTTRSWSSGGGPSRRTSAGGRRSGTGSRYRDVADAMDEMVIVPLGLSKLLRPARLFVPGSASVCSESGQELDSYVRCPPGRNPSPCGARRGSALVQHFSA